MADTHEITIVQQVRFRDGKIADIDIYYKDAKSMVDITQ